jgi:hypothetical protein
MRLASFGHLLVPDMIFPMSGATDEGPGDVARISRFDELTTPLTPALSPHAGRGRRPPP